MYNTMLAFPLLFSNVYIYVSTQAPSTIASPRVIQNLATKQEYRQLEFVSFMASFAINIRPSLI